MPDHDVTPTAEATKRCPACAESIKAEAIVCRFCSYNFASGIVQPGLVRPQSTNGLAIASLVLGIIWLYGLGSLLALIFGVVARRQIDSSGGAQKGRGMATAGLVLGIIGVVSLALIFAVVFLGREASTTFDCTVYEC